MGIRTYRATGLGLTAFKRALGMTLRCEGLENVVDRPTLFVVNHFTRFETLVVPYVLYQHTRRQVRTLADAKLFRGRLGRYLHACGVMSTRAPERNHAIVRELMTREFDWVIYPEGGLIKNRRVVRGRRLDLDTPHRKGQPHTGAAVLALQAELYKRKYLDASARGDAERVARLEERFGLGGVDEIDRRGIVVVPVTLTYHAMRSDNRKLNRLAAMLRKTLHDRVDEELQVEGTILLGKPEICIRFGSPIEVGDSLQGGTEAIRGLMRRVSEQRAEGMFIRGKARKLTRRFMRTIYGNLEIGFDHLCCWSLRTLALKRERIGIDRFRRAMFLAACEIRECDDLRVHRELAGDLSAIVSGRAFEPLDRAMRLCERDGLVVVDGDALVLDRAAATREHGFQRIRLDAMSAVIANELEPVRSATRVLERAFEVRESASTQRVCESLQALDLGEFSRKRAEWAVAEGEDVEADVGAVAAPFLLNGRRSRVGVVLTHGFLACPEEMRPLASRLHGDGIDVYVTRLEGHGTSPRDLARVRWDDWVESVLRGVALMRHHCDEIVLGGFSLGGLLALRVAGIEGERCAGVFSINAPLRLRDWRSRLVPLVARVEGLGRGLGVGPLVRRNDRSESPDINYDEHTLASLAELIRVMRACRDGLGVVRAPAMVIQATGDPVTHPSSGRMIYERLGSARKRLVRLPLERHVVVRGDDAMRTGDWVARFVAGIRDGGARAEVSVR